MPSISPWYFLASLATLTACGGDLVLPSDGGVNNSPVFTAGPDQEVKPEKGGGHDDDEQEDSRREVVVEGWATDIQPGPANESSQSVTFLLDVVSGTESLAGLPSISTSGTLRFTPSDREGAALVEVRLHDDGGTEHGGQDTSPPHTLIIVVKH